MPWKIEIKVTTDPKGILIHAPDGKTTLVERIGDHTIDIVENGQARRIEVKGEPATLLAIASAEVLRVKHSVADGQHQLPDFEHAESWGMRAANDVFENYLRQLAAQKYRLNSIEMVATGGMRIESMSITAS